MSEKARKEFEAAFVEEMVSRCGEGFRSSVQFFFVEKEPDGTYSNPIAHAGWWAWQASRESQPSGFTAVDMGTAAADGRRSLAEHLIKQIAIEHPDQDTLLTVKHIAQWIALEAGL